MTDQPILGRPRLEFDQEIADHICAELSQGRSLKSIITKDEGMPTFNVIFRWLRETPSFNESYARAREAQADALFDETLDIADESKEDYVKRKHFDGSDEGWEVNGEAIQRAKLRIDTRKWIASKLRPKRYGDRLELAGDPDAPLEINVTIGGAKKE